MNDNQSPIPNVAGGYETLQIILITVIGILIAFFIFSTYAIEYVNNNWNEYRCQPLYMMIAGILGHDPDENNKYCIEKQANIIATEQTKAIEDAKKDSTLATSLATDAANSIVGMITKMSAGYNKSSNSINKVINNITATIMFMMEKLKIIIKKLLAIATIIIYTLFSSIVFVKSMMGGTIGGITGILESGCFSGDTVINGINIKDISIGDSSGDSSTDSIVLGKMEFEYNKDYIYSYNGVKVTEDHLVLEDIWRPVKESKQAIKIPFNENRVYCLITKNNRIKIGNLIFSDFISLSGNVNTLIRNKVLELMNKEVTLSKNEVNKYYESGILNTQVIQTSKGMINIGLVKVGDVLPYYGRINAVIKQQNNRWVSINNTLTTPGQIILYRNKFIKAVDHPTAIHHYFKDEAVSINTETGLFIHSGLPILQYSEIENEKVEHFTASVMNKCC